MFGSLHVLGIKLSSSEPQLISAASVSSRAVSKKNTLSRQETPNSVECISNVLRGQGMRAGEAEVESSAQHEVVGSRR